MSRHTELGPKSPLPFAGIRGLRSEIQIDSTEERPDSPPFAAARPPFPSTAPLGSGDRVAELSAAALAHDLRSPLNAILLSMQAARMHICSEAPMDLSSLASRIERNVRTALALVDSLLPTRATQLEERRLSVAAVRLDELARETVEAMQPIAEAAGVQVKLHVDDPVWVCGNPIRVGRVISNLLANAIRHSPRGSPIDFGIAAHESTAVCHVADHGPGVPARDRSRIFEQHFQGSCLPGTAGLGLFICRTIVEQHGGRIWVEDHLPQGARFVFTLPLERGQPASSPAQVIDAVSTRRVPTVQSAAPSRISARWASDQRRQSG